MTIKFRVLVAATALMMPVTAPPAMAADYDPPIVVDQPVEEVPVEVGNGWYLRGDIGYNFKAEPDGGFDYRTFDPMTGTFGTSSFNSGSLGEQITWGVGVGYNFTDMLRADFTFDGYRMGFDGSTSSSLPCFNTAAYAGTGCNSDDGSTASALSFMLNGYVDLGTYVGFTPYVGGGLGYTYVDWSSLGSTSYCTGASCPLSVAGTTEHEGEQSWRFTYAAMAGLAYDVTKNIKVDLGYRYRHVDGGPMFSFNQTMLSAGATGTQGEDPGFATHEVRVGVRYSLW